MTTRHEAFPIEKEIAARRAHVFAAWAKPELERTL